MTAVSAAVLLFLVMDPFGNVPLFLVYLKDIPPRRQRWIIGRELGLALGVRKVFAGTGG